MSLKLFIILNILYQCNFIYLNSSAYNSRVKTYYDLNRASDYFREFKERFRKVYKDENENRLRYSIFKKNIKMINEKNQNQNGVVFGITEFTDETIHEFWNKHTGVVEDDLPKNEKRVPYNYKLAGFNLNIPREWDWSEQGIVDKPRHQEQCNSCWSFSAAGVVFSQVARYQHVNYTLSTQQMVDCLRQGGGCQSGSFPHLAFVHASKVGGFMTEKAYPYQGVQGECKFVPSKAVVKVKGGAVRNIKTEEALKNLVYEYGPVSVGVHANYGFQFYTGGIADSETLHCNRTMKINHAVVLVGYGEERGTGRPYWKVLNSAGPLWGERGFIRMFRGQNTCSILTYVATVDMGFRQLKSRG